MTNDDRSRGLRLVVCCGMPRAGSTLHYQLVVALLSATGTGGGLGWVEGRSYAAVRQDLAGRTISAVKVHSFDQFPGVGAGIETREATCVYIYRDIRDVVPSLMHIQDRPFRDLVNVGDIDGILHDYDRWTAQPSALVSKYEDVVRDIPAEVRRIAQHLSLHLADDEIQQIADDHSIDRQRARVTEQLSTAQGDKRQYDPTTLLHHDHIRSGESGSWRQMAPIEVAFMEATGLRWLQDHGYRLTSSPAMRLASRLRFSTRYLYRARRHYDRVTLGSSIRRRVRGLLKGAQRGG